jgi:hypothetical protein
MGILDVGYIPHAHESPSLYGLLGVGGTRHARDAQEEDSAHMGATLNSPYAE